ncbi:MAG: hypothetical protein HC865_19080 [Cyanobacteria bacterium RU_5_0]|nr:hypothetical protein [Cyanobacteria bacterium RU_5_0]
MLNLLVSFFRTVLLTETHGTSHHLSNEVLRNYYVTLANEAIVTQAIEPQKAGRIKFRGSWWPARCSQKITLSPGDIVYVVGRQNITLYVELAKHLLSDQLVKL